jgi:hypothetical protein
MLSGMYPDARKNSFGRRAVSLLFSIASGDVQRSGHSAPRRTRPAATGFASTYAAFATMSSGPPWRTAL